MKLQIWFAAAICAALLAIPACAYLTSQPVQGGVDAVDAACDSGVLDLLRKSPALELEAERLALPIGTLIDLVCASPALYQAAVAATQAKAADPGVSVVVRLRNRRVSDELGLCGTVQQ